MNALLSNGMAFASNFFLSWSTKTSTALAWMAAQPSSREMSFRCDIGLSSSASSSSPSPSSAAGVCEGKGQRAVRTKLTGVGNREGEREGENQTRYMG